MLPSCQLLPQPRAHGWYSVLPKLLPPDIASRLLLEKGADFGQLSPSCGDIVHEIAQFAGVWLDFLHGFLVLGVAFQHEHLVFWSTFVARAMYRVQQGAHPYGVVLVLVLVLVLSGLRGLVSLDPVAGPSHTGHHFMLLAFGADRRDSQETRREEFVNGLIRYGYCAMNGRQSVAAW